VIIEDCGNHLESPVITETAENKGRVTPEMPVITSEPRFQPCKDAHVMKRHDLPRHFKLLPEHMRIVELLDEVGRMAGLLSVRSNEHYQHKHDISKDAVLALTYRQASTQCYGRIVVVNRP